MSKTKTAIHVELLAKEHGVTYIENELDQFANTVTELSGDDVLKDDTKDLIIALFRAKVITKSDIVKLNSLHLRELISASDCKTSE